MKQHFSTLCAVHSSPGVTTTLVLAFMGIFVLILGSVASYAFTQARYGRALYVQEQALQIAEAGLEYYRWFLAHNPDNITNGTGQGGPYIYTVNDPEGGELGSASLTVAGNSACGVTQFVDITSRGTANTDPGFVRTLFARYMRPSAAESAFLLDSGAWFGASSVAIGPYHANGGLRMDGTNNSVVSSKLATYLCDPSYGSECDPPVAKPGVWGAGSGSVLWKFPVPEISFATMNANFTTLRGYARDDGLLLSNASIFLDGDQQGGGFASVGEREDRGYHLRFLSNGSVEVWRVTGTNENTDSSNTVYSFNDVDGWRNTNPIITSEVLHGTYTPPADCPLIFSQAKTWVEGTVSGKVTLIAADTGSFAPDVILQNNINYTTLDGSTGLTIIAEDSMHYGLAIPDNMSVRGVLVAQGGHYGRDFYYPDVDYLPPAYYQYSQRNNLSAVGTVVSKKRGAVCWSSGGVCVSGFLGHTYAYDRALAFSPPAFTPSASTTYKFVLWREQ